MSVASYARHRHNPRREALEARRNKRRRRENYRLWWENYSQKQKEEKPIMILLYVR